MNLPWFRLYTRMVDDEKLRLLAFEDRWHFVALCCLKGSGLLDDTSAMRDRKIAVKMGIQLADLENVKKRLIEVGLIDEMMNPVAWDELQQVSDTSSERVKKYREKQRASTVKRECNVTVTVQDKDIEEDKKELEKENSGFDQFWQLYPNKTAKAYCEKLFAKLSKPDQQAVIASMPKFLDAVTAKRKTFKDYQPPNPSTYINQRRFDDFKADPVDWNKIMVAARRLNAWSTKDWGPSPDNPDCRVPKEFITEQDKRAWLEWKTA